MEQTGDEAKKLRSQLRDAEVRAEDLSIDLESAQQQLDSREDQVIESRAINRAYDTCVVDQLKQMRKQMEENKTQNQNQPLLDELDILREKLVNAQKNEVMEGHISLAPVSRLGAGAADQGQEEARGAERPP